ncbi:MAG: hypothetical protein WB791_05250 [Waddliaceae bacterium]
MIVGIPTESYPDELRVSLVPAQVPTITNMGLKVLVEKGAGQKAGFFDPEYEKQGIANPLFAGNHSLMLFGDAKEVALNLTLAMREV